MTSDNSDNTQPLLSQPYEAPITSSAGEMVDSSDQDTNNSIFKRNYIHYRKWLQDFLESRTQHFCIITLVSLDILGIFSDIFINLYTCEEGEQTPTVDRIRDGLGIAGLVFSCLFMVELILSVWAFGWRLVLSSLLVTISSNSSQSNLSYSHVYHRKFSFHPHR
jgi:voltage-gated hydrogen channel 1